MPDEFGFLTPEELEEEREMLRKQRAEEVMRRYDSLTPKQRDYWKEKSDD